MLPTKALSVVIPMFNEAGNAKPLILEVIDALKGYEKFEIIVVDDGSTDLTKSELSELAKDISALKIVYHKSNYGQSVGIVSGVRKASYPWIVTLDGDGQNDPKDIVKLAKQAQENLPENKKILVVGHRVNRKDTGGKRVASKLANNIRQKLLRDDCPDSGCGIKLFARALFLELPHFNHLHRYLPALSKRAGAKVINVPVNHRARTLGQSKYGNWGRFKVGIMDLVGVAWLIRRPCEAETEDNV